MLIALFARDASSALNMASFGISVGVFGLLLIMLSEGFDARETKSEALLFLILFWLLMPAILSLPFRYMGASPTLLAAYFESVSAFTTTGATRLNPDELSPVLLFWRSLVQWIGGVSVATFAVVILAAINQTGTGVHKSMLFTVQGGKLFNRLIHVGALVAGVYLFLSLMAIRLFMNVEHRALFVILVILILTGVWFSGLSSIGDLLLDSAFFVSSAGFQYQVISLDLIPPVILITLALTGGSALSTAGGVKLIRILLLFRHLGTELSRLSHPSRVIPVTFRKRIIPDSAFLSIWMYFFAYTLAFGMGIAAFGVVGLGLDDAIASAAASLSNVGPLLDLTLPESGLTYAQFTDGQMGVGIVLMLLGRMEVLAALALILPNFWKP